MASPTSLDPKSSNAVSLEIRRELDRRAFKFRHAWPTRPYG
jgi:hypothetical protein